MQNQIDKYREGGDNYSSNMRQQIHKMRQEKAAWLAEAQELRNKDAENKVLDFFSKCDEKSHMIEQDVLAAQSERLAATETQYAYQPGITQVFNELQDIRIGKREKRKCR
jgi:hypothetical protein